MDVPTKGATENKRKKVLLNLLFINVAGEPFLSSFGIL